MKKSKIPRSSGEQWISLLCADPRPWLLDGTDPGARWTALTELTDMPGDGVEAVQARAAVLKDPAVKALIARLPDWEKDPVTSGHNSPRFAPNLLHLLADMGVGPGDSPKVDRMLDAMLRHPDKEGRFQSLGMWRGAPEPHWGALLCDTHAITEVLVRYGRGDDLRVRASLERMAADLEDTEQGRAWPCRADPESGFRGPGRKAECCPQVTLEALRTFARLPEKNRPAGLLGVARTSIRVWRGRGTAKPYMFGHGRQFKTVKWPNFWYDAHMVLDALSRWPALWKGRGARSEDRRGLAEMAACLIAYNFGSEGTVTPRSCYKGFESFSFGQKKIPSRFATARLCIVLRRLSDLSGDIAAVDVCALGSSKGGTGKPVPPK